MKKYVKKIMSAFLSITLLLSSGCALFPFEEKDNSNTQNGPSQETGGGENELPIQPIVPSGYTAEVGENMFWKKEDVVKKDYVEQNPDVHIYNYAPSILQTNEYTRYAYYCSNRYSSNTPPYKDEKGDDRITDYVVCRKGLLSDGVWYWSGEVYVIGPTIGSKTEGEQTCDPNVIAGDFEYDGEKYGYLMAYLACSTRTNNYNHVCLAVAKNPMGPWKKCEKINPFIEYSGPADEYFNGDDSKVPENMQLQPGTENHWGYGQASMINVDKKGRVLMLYTAIKPFYKEDSDSWFNGVFTFVSRYDMSNLNAVQKEFGPEKMDVTGIKEYHGDVLEQAWTTTNADYAYDKERNQIYAIFENNGGKGLYYVTNKSKGASMEIGDVFRDYPYNTWSMNGLKWRLLGDVSPSQSKYYPAYHNNCIIRDQYGYILNNKKIEVAVTGAQTKDTVNNVFAGKDALYTYRILRKIVERA